MKYLKLAIPVAMLAAYAMLLPATTVNAQTYKSDFSTEVILAGGGTNTGKTVTLNAAVPAANSFTLTFPGTEPGGVVGYVLTMNTTTGGLSWTNPASGLTVNLSGDVGGTSAATVIENTAGTDIVGALNNYGSGIGQVAVGSLDANVLDINSTLTVSTNALGINLTNPNTWTGAQNFSSSTATTPLTVTNTGAAGSDDISGDSWYVTNQGQASFSGGILTPSGGGLNNSGSNPTTNIDNSATGGTNNIGNSTSTTNVYGNTNINSPVTGPDANTDIDATGDKGVVTIGNNGTGSGDSSTTYLAGAVDFTGTVQLPSGSVTAGSIGLTNQYMLVGNTSNDATPLAPSANSVLITNAASPIGTPQWSQTLPSGLTYPAAQITGAGNIGGSTVINTTGSIQTTGILRTTGGGAADINTTGTSPVNIGDTSGAMNINIGNSAGPSTTTVLGNTNINSPATGPDNNTDIDATGSMGVVTIGNNGTAGATPPYSDSSTTYLAGAVNFTGTVNIPAGDLNLGLASADIFVGNGATPSIATGVAMSGDVHIDNTGKTTIQPSAVTNGDLANDATTVTAGSGLSGGGSAVLGSGTTLSINDAYGNTWSTLQTFNGGLTETGNANLNNSPANTVVNSTTNIDAGTGTEGVINIGNNGGTTPGDSSTTNMAGTVNFTGAVNIPAGDLNLGLAYENIFVGNNGTPNVAAPLAPSSNSVFITAGSDHTTPEWATTLPSDLTIPTLTASSSTNGVAGAALSLNNTDVSGTSLDVSGTGNTWNVTNTGVATFNGGVNTSDGNASNISNTIGSSGTGSTTTINGANTNINNSTTGSIVNSTTNLDAGVGSEGVINIGNNGSVGNPGDSSTTNIAGAVNFTGAVNIPAGDLNLGLASADIFVGNGATPSIATGVAMSGDVHIDNTGKTTIQPSAVTNGDLANDATTVTAGSGLSGGGSAVLGSGTTLSINDAYSNSWSTLQTFSTVTSTGNTTIDVPSPAGATGTTNINAGTGTTLGNINIGNNGTAHTIGTLDSSLTTINGDVNLTGNVDFTGTVKLPAGSVTPSSLSLTTSHLFVGNASSDAEDVGMTGDAGIVFTAGTPDVGKVTVSAASGASGFTVTNATQLNGTLTAVGQTTLGSTALSSATVAAAATLTLTTSNSAYLLTATAAPVTVNSITGANTTAGQIITLVNTDPTNNITLHSNGSLVLNGGDVIMTPGGSVTLIYDGSKWRLIGAE